MNRAVTNPFRPGAGQTPPYLAGREAEKAEFAQTLQQDTVMQNVILTGLRGVGKTVLLEEFKPMAIEANWLWAGNDLSEASSTTEATLATRILTDLSLITSSIVLRVEVRRHVGLTAGTTAVEETLDFEALLRIWSETNGLVSDKLKAVLEAAWIALEPLGKRGLIFAYDEAQTLSDHPERQEFPLALLLDVFQSIQRKNIPFMLVLTGLPTLFAKLVKARTFAERMFHQVVLDKLDEPATRKAIMIPIEKAGPWVKIGERSVHPIFEVTKGYPYFIQFVCRELYDVWTQQAAAGEELKAVPWDGILRKLDADFFSGRWARATDRQRDLLWVIAHLKNSDSEFTVQEVVKQSTATSRPFGTSHVSQMLSALIENGLIYKNRYGKYSLAVPLLDQFIRRQMPEFPER